MARDYVELEGMFADRVLGIFRVIRGFADLRDLAAISTSFRMNPSAEDGRVAGHQRAETEQHAADIKNYLENSDSRFLPEVILAVRTSIELITVQGAIAPNDAGLGDVAWGIQTAGDLPVEIRRPRSGANERLQRIRVRRDMLEEVRRQHLIRRIDGNHRLFLADQLADDPNSPTKYLAPFCLIVLGPPEDEADDYTESLIFHTINSTALPLESEHGLRLLLGQDQRFAMSADDEFAYNPTLHLTRLLKRYLGAAPAVIRDKFGQRPLTSLWDSARNIIAIDPAVTADRMTLTAKADELFGALSEIVVRLTDDQPSLCKTYSFFELAARVWREAPGADQHERVRSTVDMLSRMGRWLGGEGILSLLNQLSPAEQLLETFKAAQSRIPRRVFLARWYPAADAPNNARQRADLRLAQLRETLVRIRDRHGIALDLIDMGTEEGGTFPIHQEMYKAIASSDIIISDLTGQRPNVYIETGFALRDHEQNKLILLFEPRNAEDRVPFDLNTFKYIQIEQAAEIPNRLGVELEAILEAAGARLANRE
jgi:hypothetical protein